MKIAYTAGPMRPFILAREYTWEENIEIGKRAHDRATLDGWFVVSPHLLSGHDKGGDLCTPEQYLDKDLEFIKMVRPDIILLPRWMFSEGATREYQLAVELGLDLYYYGELNDCIFKYLESEPSITGGYCGD